MAPVSIRAWCAGLGLLGMEERVSRLGGQVRIDSQPGRGTLVAAELPHGGNGGEEREQWPFAFS